jgi:hypothetical protein
MPKNAEKYICETCDFKCSKQSNYNNHLMTAKHKNTTNTTNTTEIQQSKSYLCECGRAYPHRASLFNHKKKCKENAENAENAENGENVEKVNRVLPISQTFLYEPDDNDMQNNMQAVMLNFMQAQADRDDKRYEAQAEAHAAATAEQTRLFVDAISLKGPQCITNHNNNTTNNQFNLNVFLNEDCKDAFTLKEVMDSIECTVSDLDRMDTDGYVATITRKILESMQNMSITERPIHCTDTRRNTVCVKDETGWEKNEAALKCLNDSVYRVGRKLGRMVDDWKVTYPEHFRGTVSLREQYHRLIMDILKVSDLDVEGRIASKVCKGVVLDRKVAMER